MTCHFSLRKEHAGAFIARNTPILQVNSSYMLTETPTADKSVPALITRVSFSSFSVCVHGSDMGVQITVLGKCLLTNRADKVLFLQMHSVNVLLKVHLLGRFLFANGTLKIPPSTVNSLVMSFQLRLAKKHLLAITTGNTFVLQVNSADTLT